MRLFMLPNYTALLYPSIPLIFYFHIFSIFAILSWYACNLPLAAFSTLAQSLYAGWQLEHTSSVGRFGFVLIILNSAPHIHFTCTLSCDTGCISFFIFCFRLVKFWFLNRFLSQCSVCWYKAVTFITVDDFLITGKTKHYLTKTRLSKSIWHNIKKMLCFSTIFYNCRRSTFYKNFQCLLYLRILFIFLIFFLFEFFFCLLFGIFLYIFLHLFQVSYIIDSFYIIQILINRSISFYVWSFKI